MATTQATNLLELQQMYMSLLNQALDLTMETALNKLKSIIQKNVYEDYSDIPWAKMGYRTGQFKESWEKTKAEIKGAFSECEISQDIPTMIFDTIHTSWGDVNVHEDADNLAEIIETGNGYNFGSMDGISRDFWNEFEQWCDSHIEDEFYKSCKIIGLPITSIASFVMS
jgi:hypothetical protein